MIRRRKRLLHYYSPPSAPDRQLPEPLYEESRSEIEAVQLPWNSQFQLAATGQRAKQAKRRGGGRGRGQESRKAEGAGRKKIGWESHATATPRPYSLTAGKQERKPSHTAPVDMLSRAQHSFSLARCYLAA